MKLSGFFFLILMTAINSFGITVSDSCQVVVHDGKKMLIGPVTEKELFSNFPGWLKIYQDYQPDSAVVKSLKGVSADYRILVVLGTWCSDSRDGVPGFLKTMDVAANSHISITMVAVDRKMEDPAYSAMRANIQRVPTFVIYSAGHEIGRMVEIPLDTFESDFLDLIHDQP